MSWLVIVIKLIQIKPTLMISNQFKSNFSVIELNQMKVLKLTLH